MRLTETSLCLLALWLIPGLGPKRVQSLIDSFSNIPDIFGAPEEELVQALRGNRKLIPKIQRALESDILKEELKLLERHNVNITDITSSSYPKLLLHIYNRPPVLYYKGDINFNAGIPIAFVGSRKASFAGKSFCAKLIKSLASFSEDIVIVSGLALGIDTAAHKAALENGLKTISVLAGGLSSIYPSQNRELGSRVSLNGALVTEFPVATRPVANNFPLRNRIISGLSKGTIIVEAGQRSGASITAGYALEQNRELFAVPGPPDSVFYKGTNRLIQRSQAKLIMDAEDILEELLPSLIGKKDKNSDLGKKKEPDMSQEEKIVWDILIENGEMSQDILLKKLSVSLPTLLATLTTMELRGLISAKPGAVYQASI